jgi:hypothetical protein
MCHPRPPAYRRRLPQLAAPGPPYVVLGTSNPFESAHAKFEDNGGLSSLKPGSRVTLRCVGDSVVLGSPLLKDCVLD